MIIYLQIMTFIICRSHKQNDKRLHKNFKIGANLYFDFENFVCNYFKLCDGLKAVIECHVVIISENFACSNEKYSPSVLKHL